VQAQEPRQRWVPETCIILELCKELFLLSPAYVTRGNYPNLIGFAKTIARYVPYIACQTMNPLSKCSLPGFICRNCKSSPGSAKAKTRYPRYPDNPSEEGSGQQCPPFTPRRVGSELTKQVSAHPSNGAADTHTVGSTYAGIPQQKNGTQTDE